MHVFRATTDDSGRHYLRSPSLFFLAYKCSAFGEIPVLLFFNCITFLGKASSQVVRICICLGGENSFVQSSGTQISLYLGLANSLLRQGMADVPNHP